MSPPITGVRSFVRIAVVGAFFAAFWGFAALFGWVVWVVGLFRGGSVAHVRYVQRIARRAFVVFHASMRRAGLVDTRVELPADLPARCVLVANHPTLVDVTAILSAVDGTVAIVKPSLLHNLFVGPLLRTLGHVDGGGDDLLEGAAAIDAAVARLDQGFRVLVFPEGTRSPRGQLHPFKRGAFEIATRGRAVVVPLVVTCDPPALGKGVPFWRFPAQLAAHRIRAVAPIDSVGWPGGARRLRDHVQVMYSQALGCASPSLRAPLVQIPDERTARTTAV